MSIKFYTKEGNWDWVFNNTPVFFIRDPALFPVFIHTQKRNPGTNLKDASYFWDYLSSHQESIHQVMYTFSDRGTPYSYRHMNAQDVGKPCSSNTAGIRRSGLAVEKSSDRRSSWFR